MIPIEIQSSILNMIGNSNKNIAFEEIRIKGGGSINSAATFKFQEENYFVKWNVNEYFPTMFQLERQGLEHLKSTGTIKIPGIISDGISGKYSFLLLEAIQEGRAKADFWEVFAQQLAALHEVSSDFYGYRNDNYIGSLPQFNSLKTSWVDFFVENRIEKLVIKASQDHLLNSQETKLFLRFYEKLDNLLAIETPSLLHGDLWSGNFMIHISGKPVLIDPAVYFGHREMDIAMTMLFGGFSHEFYTAYNNYFPLETGWEERTEIYNLYPLLVHLNLFGQGYKLQIINTLKKYV